MSTWAKKLPAVAITLAMVIALSPVATAYALSASTGAVKGLVRSANTGVLLANVTVRVFDMNTAEMVAEGLTSDEGLAELGDIPLGLYQVTVVAPEGYVSAGGPLVFFDEENTLADLDFALEAVPATAAPRAVSSTMVYWILIAGVATVVTFAVWKATDSNEQLPPTGTQ